MVSEQFDNDPDSWDEISECGCDITHRYEPVGGQGEPAEYQQTAGSRSQAVIYSGEIEPRSAPKNENHRDSPLDHGKDLRIQRQRSKYEGHPDEEGQETAKRIPPDLLG